MDKNIDMKLQYIKNKFIANEKREKVIKDRENKEKTKIGVAMFIIYIVYFWIAIALICLGLFITKLIWFLMVIFWLWYLCIDYD